MLHCLRTNPTGVLGDPQGIRAQIPGLAPDVCEGLTEDIPEHVDNLPCTVCGKPIVVQVPLEKNGW